MSDKNYLEGSACPPCSSAPISTTKDYEKMYPELLKSKKIASIAILLLSVVYVKLVLFSDLQIHYKWTFLFFFLLFFTTVELFARLLKQNATRESWFWAGVMIAIPLGSALFENYFYLSPWTGLFTHLAAAQFALTRMGGAAESQAGALIGLDMVRAWFILPFSNFLKNIKVLFWGNNKPKIHLNSKGFLWTALGVVLALPICFWAFSTLVKADGMFAYSMETIIPWIAQLDVIGWLFERINPIMLFLYGFFWCWFYGLMYGAFHQKESTHSIKTQEIYNSADKIRMFPKQTINTVFVLLCGLYFVFFITQLQYLTMGFVGQLPKEYTAAEYAREGFFELVRIATVNLIVLAVGAKLSAIPLRKNKWLKIGGSVLCVCNILFAVIAFSKLWLYIERFGITYKRVLAIYAVCIILIWSVLAVVTLFHPFKALVYAIHIAAILFCIFCFVDWNTIQKEFERNTTDTVSYSQMMH